MGKQWFLEKICLTSVHFKFYLFAFTSVFIICIFQRAPQIYVLSLTSTNRRCQLNQGENLNYLSWSYLRKGWNLICITFCSCFKGGCSLNLKSLNLGFLAASLVARTGTWIPSVVGRIPWRRAWQPTVIFLPGESPWTEGPGGLQSVGLQRIGYNWATKRSTQGSWFLVIWD